MREILAAIRGGLQSVKTPIAGRVLAFNCFWPCATYIFGLNSAVSCRKVTRRWMPYISEFGINLPNVIRLLQSARYRKSKALYVAALLQCGQVKSVPSSGIVGLGGEANGSRPNPLPIVLIFV